MSEKPISDSRRSIKTSSDDSMPRTKKAKNIDLHEELHNALKNSDLPEVKKLIGCGVEPCYENTRENCYIIAQSSNDPELLTFLLNNNPKGVNAQGVFVDENDDTISEYVIAAESLLLRDIKYFKCRHAELLLDLGADVHFRIDDEERDISILHYATIMHKTTPLQVIKKLLENKSEVNKKVYLVKKQRSNDEKSIKDHVTTRILFQGCTALHCTIYNYNKRENSYFDKIKLLVESGADVNIKNSEQRTALDIACFLVLEGGGDLDLLKYLASNGAEITLDFSTKSNHLHHLIEVAAENVQYLSDIDRLHRIRNYYIPRVHAFIEIGNNLFLCLDNVSPTRTGCHRTPLFTALHLDTRESGLWNHIANRAFCMIKHGIEIDEDANQIHPVLSIMEFLTRIIKDRSKYSDIIELIFQNPNITNEFIKSKNYTFKIAPQFGVYSSLFVPIDIKYTMFSAAMWPEMFVDNINKLTSIIQWYEDLKQNNIELCDEDRSSLFSTFIINNVDRSEIRANFMEMFDYLIDTLKVDMFSSKIRLTDEDENEIQNLPQIPDFILIPALFGKIELLKKFLPYWNQQPIAVLLCLRPWIESRNPVHKYILKSIVRILPFLLECGGPLSAGTRIYSLMKDYISEWRSKDLNNMYDPEPLLQCLESHLFESPASLQVLCRTVIRNNAVGYGRNLPNHLASLVPHKTGVLKNFLALTEKYVETEFTWTRAFLQNIAHGSLTSYDDEDGFVLADNFAADDDTEDDNNDAAGDDNNDADDDENDTDDTDEGDDDNNDADENDNNDADDDENDTDGDDNNDIVDSLVNFFNNNDTDEGDDDADDNNDADENDDVGDNNDADDDDDTDTDDKDEDDVERPFIETRWRMRFFGMGQE